MPITVSKRSRLRFKDFVEVDGVGFWDLDALPTIAISADDFYYTVNSQDRIDTIATRFYGDPNLWWVIAVANDLEILPTDLQVGANIRIPSRQYVSEVLFTTNSVKQG
jgi:hypothetical protein